MTIEFIGDTKVIRDKIKYIKDISNAAGYVFIDGETGTGKELVARCLHEYSNRANKPFESINCAAITEPLLESELFGYEKGGFTGAHKMKKGLFELAEGGVLFLDEFTKIKGAGYNSLLRVMSGGGFRRIQGNEVIYPNVRILAASSSKDGLPKEMHYRFTYGITMPPLRERQRDIFPLATHFLKKNLVGDGNIPRLSTVEKRRMREYFWPGNVRELEAAMERYSVLGELDFWPFEGDLEAPSVNPDNLENVLYKEGVKIGMTQLKKEIGINISKLAIKNNGGNIRAAAAELKISPTYLYQIMDSRK